MTNMWPYLRQREAELSYRKKQYGDSFLGRYFKNKNVISEHLWSSPNHEKQIAVVVRSVSPSTYPFLTVPFSLVPDETDESSRFLLTRLYFYASVGDANGSQAWIQGTITDAQEVVKDEIWSVTVRQSSTTEESFYILESTSEVVGHPTMPAQVDHANAKQVQAPLRADWSEYVSSRIQPPAMDDSLPALVEHISWTNHEEYERGISRLWIKRIAAEGELGVVKKVVAERYILACVVGNRSVLYSILILFFRLILSFTVSADDGCPRRRWLKISQGCRNRWPRSRKRLASNSFFQRMYRFVFVCILL